MKSPIKVFASAVLLAACGGEVETDGGAPSTVHVSSGAAPAEAGASSQAASSSTSESPLGVAETAVTASVGDFEGRTAELTNPDDPTMIYLYHDLAGLSAPIDAWAERDTRVQYKTGTEKQANREMVRREIAAGLAAVKDVGLIRLTTNAGMSEYDPSYGEFTIQSLAPSSNFTFAAHDVNVSVKFANGQAAQTWQVPANDAQNIRDKVGYLNNVSLDVLLKVLRVQPAAKGGTIVTQVMSYELRDGQSAAILGRVRVSN